MGVYTSWIAVKSDDILNIQQTLMLSDTALLGLSSEQQKREYDKHHVEAYLLESRWYIIQQWEGFSQASILKTSEKYDVIMFDYSESAMTSKAQYWQAKKLIWEVFHDNSFHEDDCHLEYSGAIPDSFQTIIEKVEAQNNEVGCCYTIEIPKLLIEQYLEQEYNEFGRPKANITTSYLSYDEPYKLLQRYKISCS